MTDAFGAVTKTTAISTIVMNKIWPYGRTGAIAVKGGDRKSAGSVRALTYPLATRIAIPSLKINLPVVKPSRGGYPLCNVAMY